MKRLLLIGLLMAVLLTAGCAGKNENAQPGASQTAIQAPLLGGTGFSMADPAPANYTVTFTENVNDSGQGIVAYSGRLTLEEILRGTAAYNKIKQSYPFNLINIQPDREFMLVRFRYELADTSIPGASRLVNRGSFAIYRDGRLDADDNTYIIGATPDFYGKVQKDGIVDGWFAFTVPRNASWPLVVYGKDSAGSGIWFKTG